VTDCDERRWTYRSMGTVPLQEAKGTRLERCGLGELIEGRPLDRGLREHVSRHRIASFNVDDRWVTVRPRTSALAVRVASASDTFRRIPSLPCIYRGHV
jgi:hypothetical protein